MEPPAAARTPSPPLPAPAPAPPPAGLTLARWLYVDERRAHEVHAGVRGADEFVVKESAYANDDPDEILETATRFAEPWEAGVLLASLEQRLGLMGAYWKFDVAAPGWTRVPSPTLASLDVRPVTDEALDPGRVAFHHFRKRGSKDVVLATIPAATPRGTRYLTAEATFAFPDAEDGDVRILHPRLPTAPWTSLVLARHLDLRDRGFDKLVGRTDLELAHGARARSEAIGCYQGILRRISEGRLGSPTPDVAREIPIDDLYTDYLRNLTDPRLMALHARFLQADEEAHALAGGELAIRQLVQRKRQAAPRTQDEQMLLTILEASLLARAGLKVGNARVDPEVAALVRRFAYYL